MLILRIFTNSWRLRRIFSRFEVGGPVLLLDLPLFFLILIAKRQIRRRVKPENRARVTVAPTNPIACCSRSSCTSSTFSETSSTCPMTFLTRVLISGQDNFPIEVLPFNRSTTWGMSAATLSTASHILPLLLGEVQPWHRQKNVTHKTAFTMFIFGD